LGAVGMAFRAKLRHRWRSWLAVAILISVVGGFVLAATAAGRRTAAAFPQFVRSHGFDTVVYAIHPVAEVAKLPGVVSATPIVGPDSGQPTCAACMRCAASANEASAPQVIGGCDIRSRTSVAIGSSFDRRRPKRRLEPSSSRSAGL